MIVQHKSWFRYRKAIEPLIGIVKLDNRMDRYWLLGLLGNIMHGTGVYVGLQYLLFYGEIFRLGMKVPPIFFDNFDRNKKSQINVCSTGDRMDAVICG
jgi:hypothetical protein